MPERINAPTLKMLNVLCKSHQGNSFLSKVLTVASLTKSIKGEQLKYGVNLNPLLFWGIPAVPEQFKVQQLYTAAVWNFRSFRDNVPKIQLYQTFKSWDRKKKKLRQSGNELSQKNFKEPIKIKCSFLPIHPSYIKIFLLQWLHYRILNSI